MNLEAMASSAEQVLSSACEDEDKARMALGKYRRAIEAAKAEREDVSRHEQRLEEFETKFRADLSDKSMRKAATYAAKRSELLSSTGTTQSRKDMIGRADLLATSRDITSSLARTRDMLAREGERVNEVGKTLQSDSEIVWSVENEYSAYGQQVKTAESMLKNMQRREQTDKMLLQCGFAFFILVVAYILKRRLMPLFSPLTWVAEQVSVWMFANSTDLPSDKLPQEL